MNTKTEILRSVLPVARRLHTVNLSARCALLLAKARKFCGR